MFWLICLWLVCSPAFVLQVWIIWNTPLPVLLHTHTHTSSSVLVFTRRWVENINWRQSVPRLRGLEWGLDSESWLSSQEVLLLTTLHKHWKRDPKKMSQTHYFHCKHTDIHTDIYSSHFSLSRIYVFPEQKASHVWSVRTRNPTYAYKLLQICNLWPLYFRRCKGQTVLINTNNKELERQNIAL